MGVVGCAERQSQGCWLSSGRARDRARDAGCRRVCRETKPGMLGVVGCAERQSQDAGCRRVSRETELGMLVLWQLMQGKE